MSNNDDVNTRYTRAREALLRLVEGPTPLDENQRREADKATRLLGDVAAALEGGRDDEADRLIVDAEAAIASATPATPPAPTWTPAQPAQPAPTTTAPPAPTTPFWRRLIVAGAIVAGATGVGLAGSVVGAISVGLAAVGGLGGLAIVGAVIAVRRGGAVGLAGAAALVVAAIALAVGLAGGHIHATGGGVAAVLAGAVIAAVIAVGDDLIAAARMAMDKGGTQRPQR